MVTEAVLPKSIARHRLRWILAPRWRDVHCKNQQFSCVFVGAPGKGKTSSALSWAWVLDRSGLDKPRFSVDRVAFNSKEFFDLVNSNFPKGSAIVLDDAGLFAYSSDALTKEVKEISKIFQSIRHKNYIIFITLPVFKMLAKGVRQIAQWYAEVGAIDFGAQQTIVKYQEVQTNPKTGDSYFHSPVQVIKKEHPVLGIPIYEQHRRSFIRIDKPPEELFAEYERIRKQKMKEFYFRSQDRVDGKKQKSRKLDYSKIVDEIKNSIDDYRDYEGKVSSTRIMLKYDIGQSAASRIAKLLTDDIKMEGIS